MVAAFLTTYPFYLVPAFPTLRERICGMRLPAYLVVSSVLPYLVCCLGGAQFQWTGLVRLVALALTIGLWFVVLPNSAWTDLLFLALIQMAVMALLVERRVPDARYGFLPNRQEWRIGFLHFLYFAPVGMGLALLMGMVRLAKPGPPWLVVASLFGFLWTVALSEEFFVWGVLQEWVREWAGQLAATTAPAVIFGLVHIGFRGFPNWRWVLLAAVLGWFCGRARNRAGSIRAAMVTHALVFTFWRAFFV